MAEGSAASLQQWLAQLVTAVLFMHSHGMLHRDISTHNVFLDYNANVVVGDLGLAKRVAVSSSDLTEQGAHAHAGMRHGHGRHGRCRWGLG